MLRRLIDAVKGQDNQGFKSIPLTIEKMNPLNCRNNVLLWSHKYLIKERWFCRGFDIKMVKLSHFPMGSLLTDNISLKKSPTPPNSRIRIRRAEWERPTMGARANGGLHSRQPSFLADEWIRSEFTPVLYFKSIIPSLDQFLIPATIRLTRSSLSISLNWTWTE